MNKIILSGYIKNKQNLVQGDRVAHIWFDLLVKREYRKKESSEDFQRYDLIPIRLSGNKAIAFDKDKKNGDFLEVSGRLQYDSVPLNDGTVETKAIIVPDFIEYGPRISE